MTISLSYGPDDDYAAERYIREALRYPHRANWTALAADDRVLQTYRIMRRMEFSAASNHIRHREELRLSTARRAEGLISAEEHAEDYAAFNNWRARAVLFDGVLRQYLEMIEDRVRVIRQGPVVESLRTALLTLALAVDDHRDAHRGEESLADTALWARLNLLRWPVAAGTDSITLGEAVAAERACRGPARFTTDGQIEFEGVLVPGEVVDVADVILELTNQAEPSVSREELVEIWKQRTPDLLDSEAARVNAARHDGHLASKRLRSALLRLRDSA
jgi:hypothetical protein